jgi:hypothetical protein
MNDIDARLAALLAPPDEHPDEYFAARVRRTILAEQSLEAARRSAWRRFAAELAGTAAIVLVFLLLGSGGDGEGMLSFGPALAGVAALGLWTLVGLRPAGAR